MSEDAGYSHFFFGLSLNHLQFVSNSPRVKPVCPRIVSPMFVRVGFLVPRRYVFGDVPTDDVVGRGFARLISLAGPTHTLYPLLRGIHAS